jgi:perosamine synthetase
MIKFNNLLFKVLFFLRPWEVVKKILKTLTVSKEILLNRVTYYPKKVVIFEKKFSKYIGMNYGLTFCNGTSSIEAALFALDIKQGDEVIVPSCTFHASIDPIINCGASPIFVDIEIGSGGILIEDLIRKITPKTKCIIVVYLFGNVINIESIVRIAKLKNINIIEDVSHAHGAMYKDKKVGSFGDISCFSLQGSKAISAGEGGIALTNNEYFLSKMSMYGHFGRHKKLFNIKDRKYECTGIGHKLRANPLGIAMADIDLKFIDSYNRKATRNKFIFNTLFESVDGINVINSVDEGCSGGFFGGVPIVINPHKFNIDSVIDIFRKYGIYISIYPFALHHQMEIYNKVENSKLENTEYLHDNLLLIDRRLLIYLSINMKHKIKRAIKNIKEIEL